jgi:signal transduction histidine kinase
VKLQTRLTITVTLIIAFVAIAVGGFAIYRSESVELDRIDSVLTDYSQQLSTTSDDPLMLSQFLAEESPFPVSITYVDPDGDIVELTLATGGLTTAPTSAQIQDALDQPITLDAPGPVRMTSVALGDQDYLLVATSLEPLNNSRTEQLKLLSLFTAVMMILGSLFTWIFFRQDRQLGNLVTSLEERQKNMQEFLGDASHELRTPLTVIKGYVELLSSNRTSDPAQLERFYSRMSTEIDRMESLIHDLLLIAELSENAQRVREVFDLSSAAEHGISVLEQLEPDRPLTKDLAPNMNVLCSPELMTQLLANVFSNIRRHTNTHDAVRVTLKRNRHEVDLVIEDAGPGLPDAAYTKGIQFFQRFDQSRSRESGGSGLGMSIVRGIVNSENGTIELKKSELGGLAVHLTFPLAQSSTEN